MPSSRTLIIADIHGCSVALNTLLDSLRPTTADRVITLGDYIDRGPASAAVLTRLLQLQKTTTLIPLMGNHEELILNARTNHAQFCDWILAGGGPTLHSYNGQNSTFKDIPPDHWLFMESLLPYFETPTHLLTHATPDPTLPLINQPKHYLRWNRFENARPHSSGKPFICGHTPQKSGNPRHLGFAINLDTHPAGKGFLSCLHLETGDLLQASETGATRRSHINDYLQSPAPL